MKYVENMSEYKVFLYGWIRKRNSTWVRLPKNNDEAINILAKADTVSKALTHRTLHGVLFGRALRAMKPPAGTIGTLLTWIHGGRSYAVQEHNTDNHLQMKKISNHNKEDICVLYLFYYINVSEEVMNPNVHPKKDPVSKKREGPETRTVVLSPEKKRQRIAFIQSEVEFMRTGTMPPIAVFKFNWTFVKIGEQATTFLPQRPETFSCRSMTLSARPTSCSSPSTTRSAVKSMLV